MCNKGFTRYSYRPVRCETHLEVGGRDADLDKSVHHLVWPVRVRKKDELRGAAVHHGWVIAVGAPWTPWMSLAGTMRL